MSPQMPWEAKRMFLRRNIDHYMESLEKEVAARLTAELRIAQAPVEYREFRKRLQLIANALDVTDALRHVIHLSDEQWSCLKRAILDRRLAMAQVAEERKCRTDNPDILAAIEEELRPFDDFLHEERIRNLVAARAPRLRDYLTLDKVEQLLHSTLAFRERVYDDGFHLLMAKSLFLPDLAYYRAKCDMRDVPLVVAFMDIDKFKEFNTDKGETHVDRYMLPIFMGHLEAHMYGRGHAYRFGGDEYAVILPNSNREHGASLLGAFQDRIRPVEYRDMNRRATVSIGFCEVTVETYHTDEELLAKAEQAKNFAKRQGRDRIATYQNQLLDERDLTIVSEESVSD